MAVRFSIVSLLLLLATTSLCGIAASNRTTPPGLPPAGHAMPPGGYSCSCNSDPPPPPRVIIVGGQDKQWSFGTNYTEWMMKAGPFYVDDVLEFDYPLPLDGRFFNHSVHLLKDFDSFLNCNLNESVRVGNEYAGGAAGGFKFQLGVKFGQPYFFACGEKNGIHCRVGTMKFALMPMLRPGTGWGGGGHF